MNCPIHGLIEKHSDLLIEIVGNGFFVIVGTILALVVTAWIDSRRNTRSKRGLILTAAHEYTFALDRAVMIYCNVMTASGVKPLTKTTVFELSDYNLLLQLTPIIKNDALVSAIFALKEKYFHLKRQLDPASLYASQLDPLKTTLDHFNKLRTSAKKESDEEKRMASMEDEYTKRLAETEALAQWHMATAIAFITNAPKCLEEHKADETFEKLVTDTQSVLDAARGLSSQTVLDPLTKMFDEAVKKKHDHDKNLKPKKQNT